RTCQERSAEHVADSRLAVPAVGLVVAIGLRRRADPGADLVQARRGNTDVGALGGLVYALGIDATKEQAGTVATRADVGGRLARRVAQRAHASEVANARASGAVLAIAGQGLAGEPQGVAAEPRGAAPLAGRADLSGRLAHGAAALVRVALEASYARGRRDVA